jgi:hypothetical protein
MGKVKLHPAAKLQQAKTGLQEIQKEYNDRLTRILSYKTTDKTSFEKGGELLKVITAAGKRAKEEKDKVLKPAELTVARIKEQWRPFEDALKAGMAHVKQCMALWIGQEAARIAMEKQKILSDNRITKPETVERKLSAIEVAPVNHTRNVLELVITDESKIPREFMVPDLVAIREALKNGEVIPGATLERVKKIVAK